MKTLWKARKLIVLLAGTTTGLIASVASLFLGTFEWEMLAILCVMFLAGNCAISVYFHRYVTHKSYEFTRFGNWILRPVLGWFSAAAVQGTPALWAAVHTTHHHHSDQEDDPHSPTKGAVHSHMLWLIHVPDCEEALEREQKLRRDFNGVEWWFSHPLRYLLTGPGLAVGLAWLIAGGWGIAWYLAAVCFSIHSTWMINSYCHMRGQHPFRTGDNSGNVHWLALITFGEALHNGHHAFQKSARFAHNRGEFKYDLGYMALLLADRLGLVRNLNVPRTAQIEGKLIRA